ncbi:MAG: response regulator transcription factor [Candidatus Accumulibacter sp.]|uniref:Response regulator UvrY n=1 Tax=Candidatus Accumulibacter cognatus TaxID=2954383 RepID=A0A080MG15_9PROT|nr:MULTISPECIES: response regulator transcription factor [Candidatus Accumulibacter]MCC2867043.1 response regulator transcription factor [Candidatus Accumulibacter phosphatis]KFB76194.1 MAG: Response regulator UvrY [Candidatus Accumulibacter cognatus]MBN8519382.1 response regulator transcription factor [Accumulibacter sp.]MBO3713246.1 response regulator transcription factor [Accumulibacter sp.]MCM8579031.1 response regulator transcription factor [Accumulibacter sp.]
MDEQGITSRAKLTPVTVLVVDDHPALRAGLRSLIDSDPALRVLAEVESGEAAYAAYRTHCPDTVVMDLSMEGFGGIEAIRRIRKLDPQAAVLVYSVHDSQVLLERALEAGAMGFVTKGSNVETLLLGLKKVAKGESFVSADLLPALLDRHRPSGAAQFNRLTQREFQVFRLLSEGHSLSECASILNLSSKTVSNHFTQIRAKLGVSSLAEMAHMAIRQGLIEP